MAQPPRAVARYAAPAAFLLGVTIAVLLIHSALGGGGGTTVPTLGPVTHPSKARVPPASTLTFTQPPPTTTTASSTSTGTTSATSTTSTTGGTTSVAGAQYDTVGSGDTFFSIATRNGTTVAALQTLNPGVSSNALQVGQQIRVK